MAVIFIGPLNVPNYTALSSDIGLDGIIPGVARKGNVVLLTDTGIWKVVLDDLTLGDYALPISFNGSVDIGAVHLSQDLTDSIEISPVSGTKSVTVPGTAEALAGSDLFAMSLNVFPIPGNAGNVYLGDAGVDKTTSQQIILAPSSGGVSVEAPVGYKINLADWYIDCEAGNAGDGVKFIYLA